MKTNEDTKKGFETMTSGLKEQAVVAGADLKHAARERIAQAGDLATDLYEQGLDKASELYTQGQRKARQLERKIERELNSRD